MGGLKFIIISIALFGTVLAILGYVFWDDAQAPIHEPVEPDNNSAIAELKAMPENLQGAGTPDDKKKVAEANNKFAVDFYNNMKGEDGNIFYSPYSISTALTMTYEGAEGQTKEEMKEVFYLADDEELRKGNAAIYNTLNKKDKNYSLSTANALWAEKNYEFLDNYFGTIEQYYGGRVVNMDFVNKAEESRETINTWVEEQTNNKIKDLIPEKSINEMTRLVLTNAVYFKGTWENEFQEKNTFQEDFKSPAGTVKTEMMHQTEYFGYAEFEGLKVLEMDYSGNDLSMLVLLPEGDLDNITLTQENLENWKSYIRKKEVEASFPKFRLETKYNLNDNLKEMGMPTAFNPGEADFSGMDGSRNLYIGFVIHQGFVEVNEEGTEAAAATGVGMELTSAMPEDPKTFKADHPFIFIIHEKETGNILFMGRLENPKA
jgi:serpin B